MDVGHGNHDHERNLSRQGILVVLLRSAFPTTVDPAHIHMYRSYRSGVYHCPHRERRAPVHPIIGTMGSYDNGCHMLLVQRPSDSYGHYQHRHRHYHIGPTYATHLGPHDFAVPQMAT